MTDKKIRFFIVDDHDMIIDGLRKLLSDSPQLEFAGRANSGEQLLERLPQLHQRIDLILMDIEMPGGMNGHAATIEVKERYPHIKVIIITGVRGRISMSEAVKNRVEGYIAKKRTQQEFLSGIERVMQGEFVFMPDDSGAETVNTRKPAEIPVLTQLENEVLCRTALGQTSDQVSVAMKMTSFNVDRIRRNLMSKFKAKNVAELVFRAVQLGFCGEESQFSDKP